MDKMLAYNMPNITIIEKKGTHNRYCKPGDSRIDDKQLEKIERYHCLKIEVQRLRYKTAEVIPVVIGALNVVPKDYERILKHLHIDKIAICQIQNAALLGPAQSSQHLGKKPKRYASQQPVIDLTVCHDVAFVYIIIIIIINHL